MHHYNITVLTHAQIWYALNAHQNIQILLVTVQQKAKKTEKIVKKVWKARNIFSFWNENTIFYTVTFLALLLANSSMAMLKFIKSVSCCSTGSMARFLNRKVLILILISGSWSVLVSKNSSHRYQHYRQLWGKSAALLQFLEGSSHNYSLLLNKLQKFQGFLLSLL